MNNPSNKLIPRALPWEGFNFFRLNDWKTFLPWLVYTIVLGLFYSRLPPSLDCLHFDYISWVVLRGGVPYIDAADINFPGILLFHTIATFLFGNHVWSFRLFDYFFLLATCSLLFVFVARYFGKLAGFLVFVIYQAMYVTGGIWFSGERDVIAAPFLLGAAFALLLRIETKRRVWCIMQGICLAAATLIKPTLLILAPLLFFGDLLLISKTKRKLREIFSDHLIAGFSSAVILLGAIFIGWLYGALQEWYNVSIRFNLEAYGKDRRSFLYAIRLLATYSLKCWHWYIVLGFLGGIICWRTKPKPTVFLLMILFAAILSTAVQGKALGYHLGAMFPLFAIFIAPLTASSMHTIFHHPNTTAVFPKIGVSILIIVLIGLGLTKKVVKTFPAQIQWCLGMISEEKMLVDTKDGQALNLSEAKEISNHIKQTVVSQKTVLYWARSMLINYLSERRSPSRFNALALDFPAKNFNLLSAWKEEFRNTMMASPPELILLDKNPALECYIDMSTQSSGTSASDIVRGAIKTKYRLEKSFKDVDCYRLNKPAKGADQIYGL